MSEKPHANLEITQGKITSTNINIANGCPDVDLSSSSLSTNNGDQKVRSSDAEHGELHVLEELAPRRRQSNNSQHIPPKDSSASARHQTRSAGESLAAHSNQSLEGRLPQWYQHRRDGNKIDLEKLLTWTNPKKIWNWMKGPNPHRKLAFTPVLPRLQLLPTRYLSKLLPEKKADLGLVVILCIFWLTAFSAVLSTSALGLVGHAANRQPLRLSCTSALWTNAPTCGIDAKRCQPFEDGSFPFICPSNCLSATLLNPRTIGDQEVNYRSLVVGGPNVTDDNVAVYRGDSFICAAGIHAGVLSNRHGGCGVLTRQGERKSFPSVQRNGILSIGFPSSFPLSFSIDSIDFSCQDPQWSTLAISICATALISLLVMSAAMFFSTIFVFMFFQIGLVSGAPYYTDFASVLSTAFSRFLPAAFIAVVIYQYCVRRTLKDLRAPWERSVLWLGGCWVGALNDYTFGKIPISRLTGRDLQQQPGAITALIIIIIVIFIIAVGQIWIFRMEGRLLRYLGFYCILGIIMGCLAAIPGLSFRLHHYILALVLLPGTSTQTRPSLLYQGILVGLFINGIARWGFASILQTPAALLGDGQIRSALPTNIQHTISSDLITFNISQIARGYDGLSILVNDVERFQQSRLQLPAMFNWTRTDADEPLFFRFAFTGTFSVGGILYGDYTKPGIWFGNGSWHEMLPGPS